MFQLLPVKEFFFFPYKDSFVFLPKLTFRFSINAKISLLDVNLNLCPINIYGRAWDFAFSNLKNGPIVGVQNAKY